MYKFEFDKCRLVCFNSPICTKKRKQSLRKSWNFDLLSVIGYIHSIVVNLQHRNISKYPKLHIFCLKIMERIRNIAIAKIAMLFRMSLINNCLVRGRLLSHMVTFFSKGLSIYYVIRNGGGSSRFITILQIYYNIT